MHHPDTSQGKYSPTRDYRPLFPGIRQKWRPVGRTLDEQRKQVAALAKGMVGPAKVEANPRIPAAYTYLGQFIDHDLTLNRANPESRPTTKHHSGNGRTPRLDLDSLYGFGPAGSPHLYESGEGAAGRFRIGRAQGQYGDALANMHEPDLPRVGSSYGILEMRENRHVLVMDGSANPDQITVDRGSVMWFQGQMVTPIYGPNYVKTRDGWGQANERNLRWIGSTALIADHRNDENLIISQLHLAFLKFHNHVLVNEARGKFHEAQRLVRWHYQHMILEDFLPRILGEPNLGLIEFLKTRENAHYRWDKRSYLPTEFSVGAYRFGHAMVRQDYFISQLVPRTDGTALRIPLFAEEPRSDRSDLDGGRSLPSKWTIQWELFLGDSGRAQPSRKLGPTLAPAVATRMAKFGCGELPLPEVTLMRGINWKLPSGQRIAEEFEIDPLDGNDPLWIYVLREAGLDGLGDGQHLGPVGARLVAEVMVGALRDDEESYLNVEPDWTPIYGRDGTFGLEDLLRVAGMPFTKRDTERVIRGENPEYAIPRN